MSTKMFLKIGAAFGLLAMLLVFLGVNNLPRSSALSTVNQNQIVAGPDLIDQQSAAAAKAMSNGGPVQQSWKNGHDFGAIEGAATVKPVNNASPVQQSWKNGHDFGAIEGASNLGKSPATTKLFTYTVNGHTVVRPSELGPLTGTVGNPP